MGKRLDTISVPDLGSMKADITVAFGKLRPKKITDQNTYMPLDVHEFLIDHFSEDLALLGLPRPVDPPVRVTRRQLRDLEKRSREFWISLASLQGPAIDSLNFANPTLGSLQRTIERLMKATSEAKKIKAPEDNRGRKVNAQASEIAQKAAEFYARITGKSPVRVTYAGDKAARTPKAKRAIPGGEFPEFLAAVFKALKVVASVDRYGKAAIAVWTKNNPHWPK